MYPCRSGPTAGPCAQQRKGVGGKRQAGESSLDAFRRPGASGRRPSGEPLWLGEQRGHGALLTLAKETLSEQEAHRLALLQGLQAPSLALLQQLKARAEPCAVW